MHPSAYSRRDDPAARDRLIADIGFASIFAATPAGPRVAHTPIVSFGEHTVRFHIARANALAPHLAGATALAVVNGPDAYVSPRWYEEAGQAPTWNYVALELEGPVRALDEAELADTLRAIGARQESAIAEGIPWTPEGMERALWDRLMKGIVGFELTIAACRTTFKLSQNKSAADRLAVAAEIAARGEPGLAAMMRNTLA